MINTLVNYRLRAGFTLMELLVSITIFLIITAMVITNFRMGQYREELFGAAEAIVTSAREMQSQTIAGTLVDCPGILEKTAPKNGFGIHVDTDLLITGFGDCEDVFSLYGYDVDDDFTSTTQFTVSKNVELVSVTPPGSPIALDLVFSSLSEAVVVNGVINPAPSVALGLRHKRTGKTVTVILNPTTGRIYYE